MMCAVGECMRDTRPGSITCEFHITFDNIDKQSPSPVPPETRKHGHYFRSVIGLKEIDVYRVLQLFDVTDQAIGHAIKKLLVAGGRGAGKDVSCDVQEALDTMNRWVEMRAEDASGAS